MEYERRYNTKLADYTGSVYRWISNSAMIRGKICMGVLDEQGRFLCGVVSILLLFVGLVGCATTDAETRDAEGPVYEATGRGATFGTAMNDAKMQAVRLFVIDELGEGTEERNHDLLEEVVYGTRNPNQFVFNETMETFRRENIGTFDDPDYIYELRIQVNAEAVRNTLRSNGIDRDAGVASQDRSADDRESADSGETADEPPTADERTGGNVDWSGASDEQRAYIQRFIDSMTYMVYYDEEEISADRFLLDLAVGQANSYLASNGYYAVDASQVQRIKDDQRIVYEEETGRDVGILQWVAQRLNADVYVELDATVSESTEGDTHYGQANITMRMYETSTGQLLGSVPYRSQRTVSRVDPFDAQSNAVQSAVHAAMPRMLEQSEALMEQTLSRGIRYEITIQNTPDSRMVSQFRSQLRDRVAAVETVSQSPDSTQLAVRHYGPLDELEDLIYRVGDSTPGMEDLYQVIRRGKAVTYDTGL